MLRTARDGHAKPILTKGGKPEIFSSECDALKAVIQHLVRYINGNLVRDGEMAGTSLAAAEAIFKPVIKQKGKTRRISVSHKGKGRGWGSKKTGV